MTQNARRELYRWGSSGAAVLFAHVAILAYAMNRPPSAQPAAPPAAIVIDLAPVAAAPEVPEMDLPPAPEQPDAEAAPEQPVEEVVEEEPLPEPEPLPDPVEEPPLPETPPVPEPEVPLPPPPPPMPKPEAKVEPQPKRAEPPKKEQPQRPSVATAPRPMQAQKAKAAAPVASASERPSNAVPNWRSLVAAILERNKRYPPEARSRGERGVATVSFTINRSGALVSARLVRRSGYASLDREAVELVRRAQPFPAPPPELRGNTVTIVVPVRFNIR